MFIYICTAKAKHTHTHKPQSYPCIHCLHMYEGRLCKVGAEQFHTHIVPRLNICCHYQYRFNLGEEGENMQFKRKMVLKINASPQTPRSTTKGNQSGTYCSDVHKLLAAANQFTTAGTDPSMIPESPHTDYARQCHSNPLHQPLPAMIQLQSMPRDSGKQELESTDIHHNLGFLNTAHMT